MKRYVRLFTPIVFLAAPAIAVAAPVSSAPARSTVSRPQTMPLAQPPEVSDATLVKFIQATDAMRVVRKTYAPKIQAAATQTAKAAVRQQERWHMRNEVVKYMPVRDYMQLMRQIRHDPQLKARVEKLAHQHGMSGKSASSASSSAASGQIDDATLQKFLKAAEAVRNIRAQYRPKIAAAADATAKAQLKQEERRTAGKAIGQYMSVSEFMQIEKRMRTDAALRARAKAMVKKARTGAASASSG